MKPEVPASLSGLVDILYFPLDVSDGEAGRLRAFLTAAELRRGNRLIDEVRRRRFFVGRGILREELGYALGRPPADIELREGAFGKPRLVEEPEPVSFSVAHAEEHLLIALARGRQVGIDLELVRQEIQFAEMARRYFSEREKEELFSLPADQQLAAFYRCWTRKEAYLKGTGTGFSQLSTGFDVSLLPGEPAGLLAHRGRPDEPAKWILADLALPAPFCAAVAVEGL
ncbi:4'-phosphopantetheinyl transferase superfamily protein [Geomonas sp. Red32]|uniref:4'-phosphopantetheinyl transferase family protein n=1 Tax=Geomonas sp. Red32 TaxID=2912856 RepID=UPI00202CFA79|nr:4'-phosphopantetheinyl transferase superfamily protein [Geomonas sp. Red32]MCM0081530.1 4'-phosphopantetheinyl transferase superfamily protein [Geomonas sp. Red32]